MRVLFVHQNFPGQYKHLAPVLANRADTEVVALAINKQPPFPGVRSVYYAPKRGTSQSQHPWVADLETKVIRGEAAARAAVTLKEKGFTPDVICAHPGWGEALFLKDVWPEARLLAFMEFYYQTEGADFGFDAEFADQSVANRCRLRMKNANHLLNLMACDWGVCPTHFQKQTIPREFHNRISVVHDGIDTDVVRPDATATITLHKAGVTLSKRDEVITFVNRNLEPYRGFHVFMRALPEIQRRRPNAWVLIVGGDEVSYGAPPSDDKTYRQVLMAEVGDTLNMERIRFVGRVPYDDFLKLLNVSSVHVYLTYPFVLSWSMMEAMASECLVVGSATPPVEEVIRHGENGLLVDFFDGFALANTIDRVFDHPDRFKTIRDRARQTIVERYDLHKICLPKHLALVDALAAGRIPEDDIKPQRLATAALQRAVLAKRPGNRKTSRRR